MRLTRFVEEESFRSMKMIYKSKNNKEAVNKLGQLEDIEDKLGIDLVTLVKLFLGNYMYGYVKDEDHDKRYIAEFSMRDVVLNKDDKTLDVYWECSNELYKQYKLKDYGKTFASTREELKR